MIERDLASPIGALIPKPVPSFVSVEGVDPAIYTGFVGTWSGGGNPGFPVGLFISDEQGQPVDLVTLPDLTALHKPDPGPTALADDREALRIMESTNFLCGAALPIARETDDRIVLSDIDRLVQSMVGWRETASPAPGLPTLMIPPRSVPDGWLEHAGVIQPRFFQPVETSYMDVWPWRWYGYFGHTAWWMHQNEPKKRDAEDATFMDMIKASDAVVADERIRAPGLPRSRKEVAS